MKKKLLFTIFVTALLAACVPARDPVQSRGIESLAETRPVWVGQILSPTELTPNTFLWKVYKDDESLILIMSPAYTKDGACRYDFVHWRGDWPLGRFIYSGFCTDAGLVAYEPIGWWNPYNHLERSNKAPLSDDQFKALALFMQPAP
jgi:hypothetical protein